MGACAGKRERPCANMDHARSLDGSQAAPSTVSATPSRESLSLLRVMTARGRNNPLHLPSHLDVIYLLRLTRWLESAFESAASASSAIPAEEKASPLYGSRCGFEYGACRGILRRLRQQRTRTSMDRRKVYSESGALDRPAFDRDCTAMSRYDPVGDSQPKPNSSLDPQSCRDPA